MVRVLGGQPAGSPTALDQIGLVAQDAALYRNLSVADTLRLARSLNRRWYRARAVARMAELGIPLERRVGRLSGGQQAQVALAVALAKRPELLGRASEVPVDAGGDPGGGPARRRRSRYRCCIGDDDVLAGSPRKRGACGAFSWGANAAGRRLGSRRLGRRAAMGF